jgi:hypothetical protein
MHQERDRQTHVSSLRPAKKTFWLPILGLGVLLFPIEYILLMSPGGHSLLPVPWFVGTLSCCFVAGGLCALLTTRHLESRKIIDFLLLGSLSSLFTGIFNVLIWLVLILSSGIYNIYHQDPLAMTRMTIPTLHASWALLVILLWLFLVVGCFHIIAAFLGGSLSGLIKGCISKFATTERNHSIVSTRDPHLL